MFFLSALFFCVVTVSGVDPVVELFDQWLRNHTDRNYSKGDAVYTKRLLHFRKNRDDVLNMNRLRKPSGPVNAARFNSMNKYADWTEDELQHLRGLRGGSASGARMAMVKAATTSADHFFDWPPFGNNSNDHCICDDVCACYPKPPPDPDNDDHVCPPCPPDPEPTPPSPPNQVDWRTRGVVFPEVQDQGQCGSCWAFSSLSALESAAAIKFKSAPRKLSEQFLVDCDKDNGGCDGGWMTTAWDFAKAHGGVPSGIMYPYTGKPDGQCRMQDPIVTQLLGWECAPSDESAMAKFVAVHGPISVAVSAKMWSYYEGGILMDEWVCPQVADPAQTLDHAVNIVGYGEEGGTAYWIVRNSWGSDWGEEGYLRILRGAQFCGIHLEPCRARV